MGGEVLGYAIALGLEWYGDSDNYEDSEIDWRLLPSENLKTRE